VIDLKLPGKSLKPKLNSLNLVARRRRRQLSAAERAAAAALNAAAVAAIVKFPARKVWRKLVA
jgi:hypothetical protein